jgi:hypothetical protein
MRTSVVMRGEEWLGTLNIHLELFDMLGFELPRYAHTTVLMKIDETGTKRKLSKRKDPELSLDFYRQLGYHPYAVKIYLMTILNWNFEQWYLKNPTASSFSKSSITSNTYSVTMTQTNNGRQLYCIITDKYDNKVTTNTVKLTIAEQRTELKILTQPTDVEVANVDDKATVTVEAQGDGLKYQWYYMNPNQSKFFTCGSNSNTYSVAVTAERDGRRQYCVITDKYGNTVQSDTVTLTVAEQKKELRIITQPTDVEVAKAGDVATVTVEAEGDGLKYQWYYKNPNQLRFYACGASSPSYSTAVTAIRNGRQQYCVITDTYGNIVTTDTVTLTIAMSNNGSEIITLPVEDVIEQNDEESVESEITEPIED